MTRVCHECGENIYNPFYMVSAVLFDRDNQRIAFSDLEVSICSSEFAKLSGELKASPEELDQGLGLAIDGVTGMLGGVTGAVQLCTGYERHLQYKYLSKEAGLRLLPETAKSLFANQLWAERLENMEWQEAKWAQELYEKLKEE